MGSCKNFWRGDNFPGGKSPLKSLRNTLAENWNPQKTPQKTLLQPTVYSHDYTKDLIVWSKTDKEDGTKFGKVNSQIQTKLK